MFELTPFVRGNHPAQRNNPFRDIDDFERDFFGNPPMPDFKTDITDKGSEILLEAELPGFAKDDIHIDIDNNYLTISAERHNSSEEKDKKNNVIRRERFSGKFSRCFDIEGIDAEKITASYEDGVLKLNMPKREEASPKTRRLEIK